MCGISGVMSSFLSNPEIERFEDLMLVSNLRGDKGAGVIAYRPNAPEKDSKYRYCKSLSNGLEIKKNDAYREVVRDHRPAILVGHTRAPTKGDANDRKNVHPHHFGHIVGVHNGTLYKVDNKYCSSDKSDSAMFFEHLAQVGIDEAVKGLDGAYAFVWLDTHLGTLNFLKNDKRSLYFGRSETGQTLYWSSEAGMLMFVHGRQGTKLNITKVPDDTLITIDVDKRYNYTSDSVGWSERELKPSTTEVKYSNHPFLTGGRQDTGTTTTKRVTTHRTINHLKPKGHHHNSKMTTPHGLLTTREVLATRINSGVDRKNLIEEIKAEHPDMSKSYIKKQIREATKMIRTYGNQHIEKWKLGQILNSGCAWCSSPVHQFRDAVFFAKEEFVCQDCAATPEVQTLIGNDVNVLH